ncbi:MvaI/BcnI family restriction endonuclease [Chromatium okenii]|uniref:MvaI/BcnI family restriction endonuclease n=1 Tax=Chromatium okenii TaxID=61644 RepID=UPI0018D5A66F|nr:MvaI/BcnI family restriction endonuclease [Chromatium okenii]
MKIYTKESLIEELKSIREKGWILSNRYGNDGAVGNTLEDLLGIEENNLQYLMLPNGIKSTKKKHKQLDNTFSHGAIAKSIKIYSINFTPNLRMET